MRDLRALATCPRCKQNGLRASRHEKEESVCAVCGFVVFEPLPPIREIEMFSDEKGLTQNGPYGYRRIVGEGLVINIDELDVLSRIIELDGMGYGWYEMARILNSEGLYNRRGNEWNPAGVRALALKERERLAGVKGAKPRLFYLK